MPVTHKICWFATAVAIFFFIFAIACKPAAPQTLDQILAQAANVTEVKYDLVVSSAESPKVINTKVWVKGNKWRVELSLPPEQTSVEQPEQGETIERRTTRGYLIDRGANTVYVWYSPENEVEKMTKVPAQVALPSAMMFARVIAMSDPKIVGTETMDGKTCLVVEFASYELTGKAWIRVKSPFLVRLD
ncbi:MAG: hypothetical protein HY665_06455, partial [Chloroflexi bacterium]|nr:hypothetical protein [Chloroflexota bacterium]